MGKRDTDVIKDLGEVQIVDITRRRGVDRRRLEGRSKVLGRKWCRLRVGMGRVCCLIFTCFVFFYCFLLRRYRIIKIGTVEQSRVVQSLDIQVLVFVLFFKEQKILGNLFVILSFGFFKYILGLIVFVFLVLWGCSQGKIN